jgi:hypothetical protein
MIEDTYLDLVKSTISIPVDGCKSMAIGCPTLASIYLAFLGVVVFSSAHPATTYPLFILAILMIPLILFGIAGLAFSTAVLPQSTLAVLLPEPDASVDIACQRNELIARETHIHKWRWIGTKLFWAAMTLGLILGFLLIVLARLPTKSITWQSL